MRLEKSMRHLKSVLIIFLTLTLVASACSSDDDPTQNNGNGENTPGDNATGTNSTGTTGTSGGGNTENIAFVDETSGAPLQLQLAEGQPVAQVDDT